MSFSRRVLWTAGLIAAVIVPSEARIVQRAEEGAFRPQRSDEALAVATAIAINDARLYAMEWEQEVYFQNGDHRDLLEASEQGFDEWRWYCRRRWGNCERPGGPMTYERAEYASVDDTTTTRNGEIGGGLVRPPAGERHLYRSPETLLGRWLDISGRRTLGEVLLAADRLELREPPEDDGLVHLRAWTSLNHVYVTLDVAADPSHDFRVVGTALADALLHTVHERRTVTEFTRLGDAWIPTAGINAAYENQMTEQEKKGMIAEMARLGLSRGTMDPRDPEVQRKCDEMIANVFGERGITSVPMGVGEMEVRVRKIISVNRPIDDSKFEIEYAPTETIYDSYRDLVMSGDGSDVRPNNPEPQEPN